MFSRRIVPLIFITCGYVCAQSSTAFIAADIRKSPPNGPRTLIGLFPGSNRYELHGATMVDFITRAWGVNADRVSGGPAWLGTEHYELVAVVPDRANTEEIKSMLQKMLTERFGLAVHSEMRSVPVFAITTAKTGVKMKKSIDGQEHGCQPAKNIRPQVGDLSSTFTCTSVTISQFAEWAQTQAAGYLAGTPLVDRTNLSNAWNFALKFSQPRQLVSATTESFSFFDAAEKQLGLKISLTKAQQPVLIIDKVDAVPTATSPEALKMLSGPTDFELIVIKPSPPDSRPQASTNIFPGGRVEIRYSSLQDIIRNAWGVWDDKIVGAPSFVRMNHFDITAKAPVKDSTSGLSLESKEAMLQNLLKRRFNLVAHKDEQMGDVFALVSSKPKLKPADPGNRSQCKTAPSTNALRNRMIMCQNTTMSELADELPNFAGAYLDGKPTVDSTGLIGAFDFTINFSGFAIWQRANSSGPVDGATGADLAAAISLQDAVQQQLGLKLEIHKQPISVLVIDHIDENPTAN